MKKGCIILYVLMSGMISWAVLMYTVKTEAGVKGSCANCHTMHNKEDGKEPVEGLDPQPYLIKGADLSADNPCLGCHARSDTNYFDGNAPQVTYYGSGEERMLAGGTYHFVNGLESENNGRSCRKGHNVIGLSDKDKLLDIIPPGGLSEAVSGRQLTCAGTSGCHGDREVENPMVSIKGGHHSSVTDNYRDGQTIATSYRMLLGVKGRVADTWEYSQTDELFSWGELKSNSNVNIYQGIDLTRNGALEGTMTTPGAGGSINGLCGECHGYADDHDAGGFHSLEGISLGRTESPWLRHPTDLVMDKEDTEFFHYPNNSEGDYSTEVPVGFTNINVESLQSSTRVVLCISCHRAHGSEYDDALRWDYDEMRTGAEPDNGGCFRCHTQKCR
ncbi:MAG: cytochrome c3 family protein [bacterium]